MSPRLMITPAGILILMENFHFPRLSHFSSSRVLPLFQLSLFGLNLSLGILVCSCSCGVSPSVFEGTVRPKPLIISSILKDLHSILLAANHHVSWSSAGLISSYGRKKLIKIMAVSWSKPPIGLFKLNSDGASKGNPGPSGGGGIVRDSRVGSSMLIPHGMMTPLIL